MIMITDPVTCNSSTDTARHSGTSALIAFALLNGRRGASLAHLQRSKGAPGRGLVRLRFDQRRKRAGPILSGSSLAITATWAAFSAR